MMREILDEDKAQGINFQLIKDNNEFKVLRHEGQYKYEENLGKISEEEAFFRYGEMKK